MNKRLKASLFLSFLLFLSGCGRIEKTEQVFSLSVGYLSSKEGRVLIDEEEEVTQAPFHTAINGKIYYYEGDYSQSELASMEEEFDSTFSYCHALTDRHYHYSLVAEDGKKEKINNIAVLNENYGSGKSVKVDSFLYDLLKKSYEFTLNSEGRFNRFLGNINDIYEEKLSSEESFDTEFKKNSILSSTTGMRFSSFSKEEKEKIDSLTASLPKTKEDRSSILVFDDSSSSVTFNRYKDTNLQISLGGNAKGFATEYFCDKRLSKYPKISRIINSGSSSIKAVGERPDGREWKIQYVNPCEKESFFLDKYNPYEVLVSHSGPFNLSTSGYYEQYFYSYLPDEAGIYHKDSPFIRNSHIINPKTGYSTSCFDQVSVFLNDAGLADRYTTALRNASSLSQAKTRFEAWNKIYRVEDSGLILCRKENKEGDAYSFKRGDYAPLQENGLPLIKTGNGVYTGDFSNLSSLPEEYLSQYQTSFSEAYYLTENRKKEASLIKDGLSYPLVSLLRDLKGERKR